MTRGLSRVDSRHSRAEALRRTFVALSCLSSMLLGACTDERNTRVRTNSLPSLIEVKVPGLDSVGPEGGYTFAVARDGRLAFTGGFDSENRVITIVHTTGKVERFGRHGQGPGEFSNVLLMSFAGDNDDLMVLDMAEARISARDRSGSVTTTDLKVRPGWPHTFYRDSIDMTAADFELAQPANEGVVRMSLADAGRRVLVAPGDSTFIDLEKLSSRRLRLPLVASRRDRVVIANRFVHMFQSFDVDGRPLERWGKNLPEKFRTPAQVDSLIKAGGPYGGVLDLGNGRTIARGTEAQARARLSSEVLFQFYAIIFDDAGRLWALAPDGDFAVADIYSDTTNIGRLTLPCPINAFPGAMFRGEWLALLCHAPQKDAGIELRLFRVRG